MRCRTTLLPLAACLASLAPLASAWPAWLPELDSLVARNQDEFAHLQARQTGSSTITRAPEATQTGGEDEKTSTGGSKTQTTRRGSGMNTAKPEDQTGTRTKEPSKTIPPDAPPGGVDMNKPSVLPGSTELVKIGDKMTFAWNYTSLIEKPTAVDVILSCQVASATWTLTANMTFETEASYTWDTDKTNEDSEARLLTEMYTMIIKDSEAEISDRPEPGLLNAAPAITFGMYHKMPYKPLDQWECTGCNAAAPSFDRNVMSLAYTMSAVTVLSFTWLVTG